MPQLLPIKELPSLTGGLELACTGPREPAGRTCLQLPVWGHQGVFIDSMGISGQHYGHLPLPPSLCTGSPSFLILSCWFKISTSTLIPDSSHLLHAGGCNPAVTFLLKGSGSEFERVQERLSLYFIFKTKCVVC